MKGSSLDIAASWLKQDLKALGSESSVLVGLAGRRRRTPESMGLYHGHVDCERWLSRKVLEVWKWKNWREQRESLPFGCSIGLPCEPNTFLQANGKEAYAGLPSSCNLRTCYVCDSFLSADFYHLRILNHPK